MKKTQYLRGGDGGGEGGFVGFEVTGAGRCALSRFTKTKER